MNKYIVGIRTHKLWINNEWVEVTLSDRLLVAATELLKACKDAVSIIKESWGEDKIENISDCQACNILMQAIAKAEGGDEYKG